MSDFDTYLKYARTMLTINMPFLGYLSFHAKVMLSDEPGTAWTDGKDIWFSKSFMPKLDKPTFTFVYAHELLHKAFLHAPRLLGRNPKKWNIAADYAINLLLQDEAARVNKVMGRDSIRLLPDCLLDRKYENMSAEQIYEQLDDNQMQKACSKQDGDGIPGVGNDLRPSPQGMTADEIAEVKQQMASSIQTAKMRGMLPAGIARLVEKLLYPTRDWRNELLAFVQQFPIDYTYSPPDRRFMDGEFFFPALQGEQVDVWIVLDTSGSIGQPELERFVSESKGILDGFDYVKLKVITCDPAVHEEVDIDSFEGIGALFQRMKFKGGGGTSFVPPFELDKDPPAALVYFTDGYGDFPDNPPNFPVLWAVLEGNSLPLEEFPFGRAISVSMDHI